MATKEEEKPGTTIGLRVGTELHRALKEIAKQSGLQVAVLLRLGAERLVDEVKQTGRVPVPAVQMVSGDEETES